MKKKHFYAAVILLLFLAIGIQPVLAVTWILAPSQEPPQIPAIGTWNEVTRTFTLAGDTPLGDNIQIIDYGTLILDGAGYKITGTGGSEPNGIELEYSRHVTVKNLTVEGFDTGISLYNYHLSFPEFWVGDHTIENNTISSVLTGINIAASNENTINNNTVSTCVYGIHLAGSDDNTVTCNTVDSSSEVGIDLGKGFQGYSMVGSHNNTLTGNTVTGVSVTGGNGIRISGSNGTILTSNTVSNYTDGIRISGSNGTILTSNTALDNTYGIELNISKDYTLTGNTVSNNLIGIYLYGCNDPSGFGTLTNNIATNNSTGIQLQSSSYNTVKGNTVLSNNWGIRIRAYDGETSIENQVYNNNFENTPGYQAEVYKEETGNIDGNMFNLELPIGGNYWSDWTGTDRGDGIGVPEYTFIGGKDDLPWVTQNGWDTYTPPTPEQAIEILIVKVEELNTKEGIINSLDAKLQNALDALDAANAGQRQDAINKIEAFINAVEAQSGNQITEADADELIDYANYIIELI